MRPDCARLLLAAALCALAPPASAQLVRAPYLQAIGDTTATLVWRTAADAPADSQVRYGVGALDRVGLGAGIVPPSNPAVRDHHVTLVGLMPGTTYHYDVGTVTGGVVGGGSPEHFFRTAPPRGAAAPFTAWVLGDSGDASPAQAAVRDAMLAHVAGRPPGLFLHVGDIVYNTGTDLEFTERHSAVDVMG